jgi:hypothetical protein
MDPWSKSGSLSDYTTSILLADPVREKLVAQRGDWLWSNWFVAEHPIRPGTREEKQPGNGSV